MGTILSPKSAKQHPVIGVVVSDSYTKMQILFPCGRAQGIICHVFFTCVTDPGTEINEKMKDTR